MQLYSYNGPVMEFERCVAWNWKGQTIAPSEARARANLVYQFKKETGRASKSRITLPGKVTV